MVQWNLSGWHWLGLSLLLALLSMRQQWRPLLALVLAAISVALVMSVHSLQWYWQLSLFAGLALLGGALWYRFFMPPSRAGITARHKRRMAALIGQQASLLTPIRAGKGRLQLRDALWVVTCEQDAPAGQLVEVVGYSGKTLHVVCVGQMGR